MGHSGKIPTDAIVGEFLRYCETVLLILHEPINVRPSLSPLRTGADSVGWPEPRGERPPDPFSAFVAAKRYYIITEVTLSDLEAKVNVAIEGDGAMPLGGVWSTWEFGRRWLDRGNRLGIRRVFHQAMLDFPDDNVPEGDEPPADAQS